MKKAFRIIGIILLIIILLIGIIAGGVAITNSVTEKSMNNFVETIPAMDQEDQIIPTLDDDGYYSFKTDGEFRVMQLTDVHIGGGFLSAEKDTMALTAVARMISAEKPDLVVVTGDIGFPVPYSAGTLNNKTPAVLFAQAMENLGVYWCLAFGNHDTEAYSYFDREAISEVYNNKELYPHCLFQIGPEDVDGYGNYVINVRNSTGEITQSLFMFDSHSYIDNDYFGILWKYDCVHENQIAWYNSQIEALTKENAGLTPKSLAFMHIPMLEVQEAYYQYRDNNFQDTDRVQYLYGKAGESGDIIVYSSKYNNGLFDAFKASNSTKGVFFGHDHLNSFSMMYDGIRLSYGHSIDYLAYSGIYKYGAQRGCNMIELQQDGSFDCHLENYYQDKYQSQDEKATVSFDDYGTLD